MINVLVCIIQYDDIIINKNNIRILVLYVKLIELEKEIKQKSICSAAVLQKKNNHDKRYLEIVHQQKLRRTKR